MTFENLSIQYSVVFDTNCLLKKQCPIYFLYKSRSRGPFRLEARVSMGHVFFCIITEDV